MILPIVAYGDPILRKETVDIDANYPNLKELIANMFETMYNAQGVGLAGPQIGKSIRLFIVDTEQVVTELEEDEEFFGETGIKKAFINAEILEETGDDWAYLEGCLSIPDIREDVVRGESIRIQYYDENFQFHDEEFDGLTARVILHEYDHIEGTLFLDYLSGMKKRLLKGKLAKIAKGEVNADYRMRFPALKKRR